MAQMHFCEKTKGYVKCALPDYCECQSENKSVLTSTNKVLKTVKDASPQVSKNASNNPTYENELSLYTEELMRNIEEFRKERAGWKNLAIESDVKTIIESIEEELSSDVYKGRCILLRKMGFKINRLRNHYQTLRPLKYYTLKEVPLETTKREKCIESSKTTLEQTDEKQGLEQRVCKKPKKKKVKIKEKSKTELKPIESAKRILEKIKPKGRRRKTLLESCKCEDGKEVTFIIKGVCLCDKNKKENLTTNKNGEDRQSKTDSDRPIPSDSLEFHRKQMQKKSLENPEKSVKHFDDFEAEKKEGGKSKASIKFKEEKDIIISDESMKFNEKQLDEEKVIKTSLEEEEEEKANKKIKSILLEEQPPKQKEEVGIVEKKVKKEGSELKRKVKSIHPEEQPQKQKEEVGMVEKKVEKESSELKKKIKSTFLEEKPQKQKEEVGMVEKKVEKEGSELKKKIKSTFLEEKPQKQKEEVKIIEKKFDKEGSESNKPPSLVTLFRNRNPTKKSDLALTKEQKNIIDKYNKKREKIKFQVMRLIC